VRVIPNFIDTEFIQPAERENSYRREFGLEGKTVVMYAGKVVEEAPVRELFAHPRHPYTQGLIRSIPRIDMAATHKVRLEAIAGTVPKLVAPQSGGLPPGCRFAPRCRFSMPECTADTPALRDIGGGHKVACILDEVPA